MFLEEELLSLVGHDKVGRVVCHPQDRDVTRQLCIGRIGIRDLNIT